MCELVVHPRHMCPTWLVFQMVILCLDAVKFVVAVKVSFERGHLPGLCSLLRRLWKCLVPLKPLAIIAGRNAPIATCNFSTIRDRYTLIEQSS